MPQLFTLYPDLTADENVDFVATPVRHAHPAPPAARPRGAGAGPPVGGPRTAAPGQLSGGMQRRLELASALVHEPALLLLDEPTAGIDPILRKTIWEELDRLKAAGRTLLVTTQYVTEAEGCDAVALIAGGRLVALGPPEELRRERGRRRRDRGARPRGRSTPRPWSARRASVAGPEHRPPHVPDRHRGRGHDHAGAGRPRRGGRRQLTTAREVHLSFDEVFASSSSARGASAAESGPGRRRRGDRGRRGMNPFIGAAKILTRLLAFIGRELIEVRRRPGALASLVFGPFLVMAVFGLGYNGYKKPLPTLLVIPPESGAADRRRGLPGPRRGRPRDRRRSCRTRRRDARLESGEIEVVGDRPGGRAADVRVRPAVEIEIRIDVADPVQAAYAALMANEFANVGQPGDHPPRRRGGPGRGRAAGAPRRRPDPTRVIAAPTRAEVVNIAPVVPTVVGLLRARRARADPPAHGRDPDRALGRARPDERRDRAVPGVAGVGLGGRRGQDPRVRGPVRGDRGWPASSLLDRRARRADARDARRARGRRGAADRRVAGPRAADLDHLATPSARPSSCRCWSCWPRCSSRASCCRSASSPRRSGSRPTLIPVTSGIDLIQDVMLRGTIREPWQAAAPGRDRARPAARVLAAAPPGHVAAPEGAGGPRARDSS